MTMEGLSAIRAIALSKVFNGGGSSKVVIGTFTGGESKKGTAIQVPIAYTGSGYPVAGIVFPSEGSYKEGTDFYNAVQRYAINKATFSKSDASSTPDYADNSSKNQAFVTCDYKSSDSVSTAYSRNGYPDSVLYKSSGASSGSTDVIRFSDANTMSVYIASTSYGFMADVEYTYIIYYSE